MNGSIHRYVSNQKNKMMSKHKLQRCVCRAKPVQPVHNKWSKHSQCSHFYTWGDAAHGNLTDIIDLALGHLDYEEKNSSAKTRRDDLALAQGALESPATVRVRRNLRLRVEV